MNDEQRNVNHEGWKTKNKKDYMRWCDVMSHDIIWYVAIWNDTILMIWWDVMWNSMKWCGIRNKYSNFFDKIWWIILL